MSSRLWITFLLGLESGSEWSYEETIIIRNAPWKVSNNHRISIAKGLSYYCNSWVWFHSSCQQPPKKFGSSKENDSQNWSKFQGTLCHRQTGQASSQWKAPTASRCWEEHLHPKIAAGLTFWVVLFLPIACSKIQIKILLQNYSVFKLKEFFKKNKQYYPPSLRGFDAGGTAWLVDARHVAKTSKLFSAFHSAIFCSNSTAFIPNDSFNAVGSLKQALKHQALDNDK